MPENSPACPECGKTESVIKVNKIYVESLSSKPDGKDCVIAHVLHWPEDKAADSKKTYAEVTFLKYFNPPAGKTIVTRQVHPDMYVGIFSILVIALLYQIHQQQRNVFFIALGIVVVFYIVYFAGRKYILGKYQHRHDEEVAAGKKTESAIGRWMKMYYCCEDGIVFNPEKNISIPLDQMRAKLLDSSN
jgi:hypothetical protein